MENAIQQEKRFSELERRVSIVETHVDNIKEDVKEIKEGQSKIMWWIIGTLGTSILSLVILIVNMLRN